MEQHPNPNSKKPFRAEEIAIPLSNFHPPDRSDYQPSDADLPVHLHSPRCIDDEPTPELEPKPKKWQYFVLLVLLIGSLWLADIFGFAIPTFLDELISNTVIVIVYGLIGYKITFPKRKS